MFSDNMSGDKWQQVADLIARLGLVDVDQPTTAAQVNRMTTHQLLQDPVRAAIYRRGWDDRTADIQRTLQLQPRSTRVPPTTMSRPPTTPARPPQRDAQRSPKLPAPRSSQRTTPRPAAQTVAEVAASHAKMDVMSIYNLLEDEADDELLLLVHLFREESDAMYSERNREGCYNNLIQRRLIDNETRFRAYFRVSFELFNYILNYIREDIKRPPCNRVKKPISPEEKLSVTLR
ncbi:hypothetical protein ACI65C_013346 [Semiaphis heraclei]